MFRICYGLYNEIGPLSKWRVNIGHLRVTAGHDHLALGSL